MGECLSSEGILRFINDRPYICGGIESKNFLINMRILQGKPLTLKTEHNVLGLVEWALKASDQTAVT